MADYNVKVNKLEVTESSIGDSILLHENYLKLKEIAEGILTDRYRYMKLKAPGFMDLIIEKLWNNRISLSHYYQQNGDLMADPDVEIIVDQENEKLVAATFQQDNLGIYHKAYEGDELIDDYLAKELNEFLSEWLNNISEQGHIPVEAYYSDDIVIDNDICTFDEEGNEITQNNLDEDLEL